MSLQSQAVAPILVEMEGCVFPTTTTTTAIAPVLTMEAIVSFQVRITNCVQRNLQLREVLLYLQGSDYEKHSQQVIQFTRQNFLLQNALPA